MKLCITAHLKDMSEALDWIKLFQDRAQWWDLWMNLRDPEKTGNFLAR
jgi:hypothetical protein